MPARGPHISITFGAYESIVPKDSGAVHNKEVFFEYENQILTNGRAFWLPVICPEIAQIRISMGLPPETRRPPHLTIGNIKNELL